ncbi:inositol monophosphatase family protein [Peribacillus huizhouensis]|uniref:Inositol-1-monophosphatase n=1 Tax=Peribacillus huizhouensis TaxID=1501239 RepID=A0ABR6CN02_9BACI|nr:inositol monophosphatase family protein [Peribacillus huizhouensis]MBA9026388.1 myo-inositol-1(or 4)-monophosphatase [Peribacillus huizhouensis]
MNQIDETVHTLLHSAITHVKNAGELLIDLMRKPIDMKEKINQSDLVTEVDVIIEEYLCGLIREDYPDHWILSEEDNAQGNKGGLSQSSEGYGWIIDPIDGTTNFIHRIPYFAISVGIVKDGFPVCGVVYNPLTKDLYSAQINGGAFLNGERIQVGSEKEISESLLATGFPAYDWKSNSDGMKHMETIVGKARSIRIIGAASLDLCMVAAGKLTGFFHDGLHPWDVAAGIIILKEAGGTVTNREGNAFRLGDHTLVASNTRIQEALVSLLN